MNITIRQATIDDANIIAHAVAMAIGEESVLDYCGNNYIDVLTEIAPVSYTHLTLPTKA